MNRRQIALALLLAFVVAAPMVGPDSGAVHAQAASSPFGVNTHVATRFGRYSSQHVPLDVIARHNVSWIREEFRWDVVQRRPNEWDWGFTDELVEKANARGLSILGLLVYSVGWANPSSGAGRSEIVWSAPENLEAYQSYVFETVRRYRGRVRAWEVWNEPNHDHFWRTGINPEGYAAVLRAAAPAIRAADPSARIVLAGVSGSDIAYLERVIAATGWDSFDVLAAHPYVAPKSPERGGLANVEIAKLRALVERHGATKPIWLTEIGWPTSTPGRWGVGDGAVQANYAIRSLVQATTSPGVERAFWYNWRNDGNDSGNDENNFGLVGSDWRTPKPAATALRTLTQKLDNATFVRQLDLRAGARRSVNDFEGEQSWHIWGDGAAAQVERTAESSYSGQYGAIVRYGFSNGGKAYVDLQRVTPIDGEPRRLGLWARGDSSGHLLWATFLDAGNEYFRVRLCALAAGWQRCEASLDSAEMSDGDGIVNYPIRFQSLIVDNEPDGSTGLGSIVIDDLYVEDGPELYGYRYDRGGQPVDVLWTVGAGATVQLATSSPAIAITNRDGQSERAGASDGAVSVEVGEAPVFVEHLVE